MPKPKKQITSKYVLREELSRKIDDSSFENRMKKFLESKTAASYITQTVLVLTVFSGAMALGALAPGLTVAARQWQRTKGYNAKQLSDGMANLRRGKYLTIAKNESGKKRLSLSKKGEAYLMKILFEDIHLPEPEEWEGKWTFVLFDIPQYYSASRNSLRVRLRTIGFYQYQKSVWVYPHPCEQEVLFLADYFGVGKYVEVLSVDHLSKDNELKKHFGIKK